MVSLGIAVFVPDFRAKMKWVVDIMPWSILAWVITQVPTVQETNPRVGLDGCGENKMSPPPGYELHIVQPVANHYTYMLHYNYLPVFLFYNFIC